jgi:hypothetical protein
MRAYTNLIETRQALRENQTLVTGIDGYWQALQITRHR